jgi:hypothetical protein
MAAVMEEDDSLLAQAWKRIRFLGQELFRLDGKVHGLEATIADLGEPVRMDPDAPPKYPPRDYEDENAPLYSQREVRFLMGAAAQDGRRSYGGNHHHSGNGKLLHWLIGINTAAVGWAAMTLIHHGEELARLEAITCQANVAICEQLRAH